MGRWRSWILSSLNFTIGNRILEIGHGPGHVLSALSFRGNIVFGMDASQQMGQISLHRLKKVKKEARLVRGRAQFLPFAKSSLTTVIATFPTAYIFQELAIQEFFRVLAPGGRLVVVLSSWITEKHLLGRFLLWIYKISGQAMPEHIEEETLCAPFRKAGFEPRLNWMALNGSQVLILLADKPVYLPDPDKLPSSLSAKLD